MATALPVHSLVAFNTAAASENKIHDDGVAAAYGFRGGLVPGVDVYAYLCRPAVEVWGRDFLGRGTVSTRFAAPTYDGEEVEVRAEIDDDGVLRASVYAGDDLATGRDRGGAGDQSGSGSADQAGDPGATAGAGAGATAALEARLIDDPPDPPTVATATPPDPAHRPPATPESLSPGTVLGTFTFGQSAEEGAAYLASVRDEASPVTELGLVHPGALLRLANTVLSQTVRLGPWIHVGSEIHNYGPVSVSEPLEVRGAVTAAYERKGHRFVELDVVLIGPHGSTRCWIEHTAIYQPRRRT